MSDEERSAILEMKTDIAGIKATLHTMAETNRLAIESMQSVRSAHHRIDTLKRDTHESITTLKTDTENDIGKLVENLKWLWTATIGVFALSVTVFALVVGS